MSDDVVIQVQAVEEDAEDENNSSPVAAAAVSSGPTKDRPYTAFNRFPV